MSERVHIKFEKVIDECRRCPFVSHVSEQGFCAYICNLLEGYGAAIPDRGIHQACPFRERQLSDFNRGEVLVGDIFRLKGSKDKFKLVKMDVSDEEYFLNLSESVAYPLRSILDNEDGFTFFRRKDDEDFLGVEIVEGE